MEWLKAALEKNSDFCGENKPCAAKQQQQSRDGGGLPALWQILRDSQRWWQSAGQLLLTLCCTSDMPSLLKCNSEKTPHWCRDSLRSVPHTLLTRACFITTYNLQADKKPINVLLFLSIPIGNSWLLILSQFLPYEKNLLFAPLILCHNIFHCV